MCRSLEDAVQVMSPRRIVMGLRAEAGRLGLARISRQLTSVPCGLPLRFLHRVRAAAITMEEAGRLKLSPPPLRLVGQLRLGLHPGSRWRRLRRRQSLQQPGPQPRRLRVISSKANRALLVAHPGPVRMRSRS